MENMMKELTRYRVKIERDGKSVADIPGIVCLPGLLAAPRLSIAGIIAAPLLGCNIHLENKDGKKVDIEKAVQKAAETVIETANTAVKTVKEEVEKAWQAVSAEDQPETEQPAAQEEAAPQVVVEEIAEAQEAHEAEDAPAVHVNPDDSAQA